MTSTTPPGSSRKSSSSSSSSSSSQRRSSSSSTDEQGKRTPQQQQQQQPPKRTPPAPSGITTNSSTPSEIDKISTGTPKSIMRSRKYGIPIALPSKNSKKSTRMKKSSRKGTVGAGSPDESRLDHDDDDNDAASEDIGETDTDGSERSSDNDDDDQEFFWEAARSELSKIDRSIINNEQDEKGKGSDDQDDDNQDDDNNDDDVSNKKIDNIKQLRKQKKRQKEREQADGMRKEYEDSQKRAPDFNFLQGRQKDRREASTSNRDNDDEGDKEDQRFRSSLRSKRNRASNNNNLFSPSELSKVSTIAPTPMSSIRTNRYENNNRENNDDQSQRSKLMSPMTPAVESPARMLESGMDMDDDTSSSPLKGSEKSGKKQKENDNENVGANEIDNDFVDDDNNIGGGGDDNNDDDDVDDDDEGNGDDLFPVLEEKGETLVKQKLDNRFKSSTNEVANVSPPPLPLENSMEELLNNTMDKKDESIDQDDSFHNLKKVRKDEKSDQVNDVEHEEEEEKEEEETGMYHNGDDDMSDGEHDEGVGFELVEPPENDDDESSANEGQNRVTPNHKERARLSSSDEEIIFDGDDHADDDDDDEKEKDKVNGSLRKDQHNKSKSSPTDDDSESESQNSNVDEEYNFRDRVDEDDDGVDSSTKDVRKSPRIRAMNEDTNESIDNDDPQDDIDEDDDEKQIHTTNSSRKRSKKTSKKKRRSLEMVTPDKRTPGKKSKRKKKTTFATGYQMGNRDYKAVPLTEIEGGDNDNDADGNVRRSKRKRVQPLAFWKNERLVYEAHNEEGFLGEAMGDMPVVTKVLQALPTPYKKRKVVRNSKKGRKEGKQRGTGEKQNSLRDNSPITPEVFDYSKRKKKFHVNEGDEVFIWDEFKGEVDEIKLIRRKEDLIGSNLPLNTKRGKGESNVVGNAAQAFNVPADPLGTTPGWIGGNLSLPPLGIKDAEGVGLCTQVFNVGDCQPKSLELAIADPEVNDGNFDVDTAQRFMLSKGDTFYIPAGNVYRVENLSKTVTSTMTWTIIRPMKQNNES